MSALTPTQGANEPLLVYRWPAYAWLIVGTFCIVLSSMRWNIALVAWFTPVPWLIYVSNNKGWRANTALLFALLVAMHLAVFKIITPPVSFAMAPMFAIPNAITLFIILIGWNRLRKNIGPHWSIYTFTALIVVVEWLGATYSELGVWGASANTQIENLPLLQSAAVFGIAGIAFIMNWFAALLATIILSANIKTFRWHIIALTIVVLAAYSYGSIRLTQNQFGPQVRAAAVATDLLFSGELPTQAVLDETNTLLFERTQKAAELGAQIVVWNEGATAVYKKDEAQFISHATQIAQTNDIHLILAYIVPVTLTPLTFENKYLWIRSDGTIAEEYFKHHPVPGEGSIKGMDALRVIKTEYGNLAGAICYDYDFPAMSREHARLGAGLVLLPSSDWQGIDPIHTQMVRLRAIEGGLSVMRSVRAAASAGFDAYGRVRGWMDYYTDNNRILVTNLPTTPVPTIYAQIGDVLPFACILLLTITALLAWRRR